MEMDHNTDMLESETRAMFVQAIKWGHTIKRWWRPERGGWVYKLIYNPDHKMKHKASTPTAEWIKENHEVPPDAEVWIPKSWRGVRH